LSEGRIAILVIGSHPVFLHLHAIADSLHIPYIAIKWESLSEENSIISRVTSHVDDITDINQINIHPPAHSLVNAIIDLIFHFKWEFVTVLFQESTGLGRIDDLVKIHTTKRGSLSDIRIQVRQLDNDVNKWIYLIKDVKLSGSSHFIVDIQTKYINKFIEYVNKFFLAFRNFT
jgi:hypothetical protein